MWNKKLMMYFREYIYICIYIYRYIILRCNYSFVMYMLFVQHQLSIWWCTSGNRYILRFTLPQKALTKLCSSRKKRSMHFVPRWPSKSLKCLIVHYPSTCFGTSSIDHHILNCVIAVAKRKNRSIWINLIVLKRMASYRRGHHVSKCMYTNVPKWSWMYVHVSKCMQMYLNVCECMYMYVNVCEWS